MTLPDFRSVRVARRARHEGSARPPREGSLSTHRAITAVARAGEDPRDLLAEVGLDCTRPRPVIVVCGGAEGLGDPGRSAARRIIASAVVDAAQETGAAVVDGGTASGVMELVGEECGDQSGSVLVGVAPAGRVSLPGEEEPGRVPLERHHTHFVLHDSDAWGNETELLIELSAELAAGARVIMVLAGGGAGAQAEVRAAAARGWPVFVIEGTGGMADEIAARCRSPRRRARADDLNEVITQGTVETLSGHDARGAARRLIWELQDEPALKDAWVLCAAHDELAARLRRSYERFQVIVVLLAVTATVLALLHQQLGGRFLHWAAIPAPVLVSVLIALVSRRAVGRRWLVLRAAAEAIKSETYRYRTRTGVYAGPLTAAARARRSQRLSARLDIIEAELMRTEASCGPLQPYVGPLPPSMCAGSADHAVLSRSTRATMSPFDSATKSATTTARRNNSTGGDDHSRSSQQSPEAQELYLQRPDSRSG